jgi:sarcosine/dimethylglycine N-methyltransferase
MNDTLIRAPYSTGLSRRNIERVLVSAGKDLDHLQPLDLALLKDFHTMGPRHQPTGRPDRDHERQHGA